MDLLRLLNPVTAAQITTERLLQPLAYKPKSPGEILNPGTFYRNPEKYPLYSRQRRPMEYKPQMARMFEEGEPFPYQPEDADTFAKRNIARPRQFKQGVQQPFGNGLAIPDSPLKKLLGQ